MYAPFPRSTHINTQLFMLTDDPKTFWNAPIGLQIVGRCQEEEAVIAMTEIVDAALKKSTKAKL